MRERDDLPELPIIPIVGMLVVMLLVILGLLNPVKGQVVYPDCSTASLECPNDLCEDAIYVEELTPTPFCNCECNEDFGIPDDPSWVPFFPGYPCQYPNYDMWYQIEVESGSPQIPSPIEFYVGTNYVHEDSTTIGNFGPLEGVTLDIWSGDYPDNCMGIDFVFGTNCYFNPTYADNVESYCCFPEYDPTRQEWYFTVQLPPGIYYVNIDGFGYSEGCGEWWWAEPYFLGTYIEEVYKKREKLIDRYGLFGKYDLSGRRIK